MYYYVVQVRTGMEEKFVQFDKTLNRDEEVYSIIFPQRILKIRKAGKFVDEKVPVFKGYVFIECENFTDEIYQKIKKLKGFYRFLPDNEFPKYLYGRDLEILNYFIKMGGVANISLVSFDQNDRIVILKGPLKGFEGQIVKVDKRKKRAKVKMDAYNSSFQIDFSFEVLDLTKKNVGEKIKYEK